MDAVSKEGKELTLLGDCNKNLAHEQSDLGLSQMVSQPTQVTPTSSTLIDHICTKMEENIIHVSVSKISISGLYVIWGNRKLNFSIGKHCHQAIS